MPGDGDGGGDGLFECALESWRVDGLVGVVADPLQEGGVAGGVEGVQCAFAVASMEAFELDVGHVEAVHGHVRGELVGDEGAGVPGQVFTVVPEVAPDGQVVWRARPRRRPTRRTRR